MSEQKNIDNTVVRCDGCDKNCELGAVGLQLTHGPRVAFFSTVNSRIITYYMSSHGWPFRAEPVWHNITASDNSDAKNAAIDWARTLVRRCAHHRDLPLDSLAALPELDCPNKEMLTMPKLQEMFGDKYKCVSFYNFDTGFMTNGYDSTTIDAAETYAMARKNIDDRLPGNQRVVAIITTDTKSKLMAHRHGDIIENPKICNPAYRFSDSVAIGTIVLRDMNTGRILPHTNKYVFVKHAFFPDDDRSLQDFADMLRYDDAFCDTVIKSARPARQTLFSRLRQKLR